MNDRQSGTRPSTRRARRTTLGSLVVLQIFVLVASLVGPAGIAAVDPTPTPTEQAPAADPSAEPSAEPTPVEPTPAPDPTPAPTAAPVVPAPTIASDLPDYRPGARVTLTGAGWDAAEPVHIVVNDTIGQSWSHIVDVVADQNGAIVDVFNLPNYFVSDYDVTATGPTSGVATTTFTDNAQANLDQCANGSADDEPCLNPGFNNWVNGNLGASKSLYREGDSIPYRLVFTDLTIGTHAVTFAWDTTKSGKHAIDYLTTWDRSTNPGSDPCSGVAGCDFPVSGGEPIPLDANVASGQDQIPGNGDDIIQIPGVFRMANGAITGVSAYTRTGSYAGDSSTSVTISFTVTAPTAVLAWGGHIATRLDWGPLNAATAISGSPYHTRLDNLDGTGGNQDRSLSSEAVIFPGSITIIKAATPEGSTSFPFTASPAPLTNFALVDDNTATNTKVFSNITNFTTYTVDENPPAGWNLTSITCSVTSDNGGSATSSVLTGITTFNLKEGENRTCTVTNDDQAANLNVIKHVVNDNGGTKTASHSR